MTDLTRRTQAAVLLRSLAVQGSWNYQTLIGTGFAFTILPALRALHAGRPRDLEAALARHAGLFNSHPYFATLAAGAVTRLEREGADEQVIDRFKGALRGSLGALGDHLIWSSWRPATLLLAIVLLLAGLSWWVAIGIFLLVYNALHIFLRVWGLRVGLASGLQVGKALREAPLQPLAGRTADTGAVLAGLALVLFGAGAEPDVAALAAMGLGTGVGLWLGLRTRPVMAVTIGISWLLATIAGWIL